MTEKRGRQANRTDGTGWKAGSVFSMALGILCNIVK